MHILKAKVNTRVLEWKCQVWERVIDFNRLHCMKSVLCWFQPCGEIYSVEGGVFKDILALTSFSGSLVKTKSVPRKHSRK